MKKIVHLLNFLKDEYMVLKEALMNLEAEYSTAEIKMEELCRFIMSLEEDTSDQEVFSPYHKSRINSESISLEKEKMKVQQEILDDLSKKVSLQKAKCEKYEKAMKELSPFLNGDLLIIKKDKTGVVADLIALCEEELEEVENEFSDMVRKFAPVDSKRVLLDSKKYFKRMAKIREKLEECKEMLKENGK